MKNKKKIWGRIFIGFVLLVVIFWWLIIMGIFDNFFEPHFKIYKEECRNETLNPYIESSNQGCHLACYEFEYDNLGNCLEYCDETFVYQKEVCEQVEVDEINLGVYEEFVFRDEGTLSCFNKCYFKGEIDENFSGFVQPKKREEYDIIKYEKKNRAISKQDLTIEWLDGNCEIARCTPCEDLDCKNQECNLYSCGNYIVEVNK